MNSNIQKQISRSNCLQQLEKYFPRMHNKSILLQSDFPTQELSNIILLMQYAIPFQHWKSQFKTIYSILTDQYWEEIILKNKQISSTNQYLEVMKYNQRQIVTLQQLKQSEQQGRKKSKQLQIKVKRMSYSQIIEKIKNYQLLQSVELERQLSQTIKRVKEIKQWRKVQALKYLKQRNNIDNYSKKKLKNQFCGFQFKSQSHVENQSFEIIIGGKISQEVKVIKQEMYSKITDGFISQKKIQNSSIDGFNYCRNQIQLWLNKLTFEFFDDIYRQILSIVPKQKEIWAQFVKILVQKCHIEHNFIQLYVVLLKKLTKIPKNKFIDINLSNKFNMIHVLLTDELQKSLQQLIEEQKFKLTDQSIYCVRCNGYFRMIGSLINEKILSKNVFKVISMQIIDLYFQSKLNAGSDESLSHPTNINNYRAEALVQSISTMIEYMGQVYCKMLNNDVFISANEIQAKVEAMIQNKIKLSSLKIKDIHSSECISLLKQINNRMPSNRAKLGFILAQYDEQMRRKIISCKVKTISEKKSLNKIRQMVTDWLIGELSSLNLNKLIMNDTGQFCREYIKQFASCNQNQMQQHLTILYELLAINDEIKQVLVNTINDELYSLMLLYTDLPFLTSGLGKIFSVIGDQNILVKNLMMGLEQYPIQSNQDKQDVEQFVRQIISHIKINYED